MGINQHTDLDVWKLADQIRREVAEITTADLFKDREFFWLRDQMRRAAHSACTNIAEGFGRYNPRDFGRFLKIARASLVELAEHLREPSIASAVSLTRRNELVNLIDRATRASPRFIRYLGSGSSSGPIRAALRPVAHERSDQAPGTQRTLNPTP